MDTILQDMEEDETALIVSHATAICSYLLNFCKMEVADAASRSRIITIQDQEILQGKIEPMDYFEIEYVDGDVEAIRFYGRE